VKAWLRVLVLGLDGLYLELFQDKLSSYPGFRGIKPGNSVIAKNRAFKPVLPLTYPSWASIETGARPAVHGLPDFFERSGRLLDASVLNMPRVYEAAGLAGKRVLVINPVPSHSLPVPHRIEVVAYDMFSPRLEARGEIALRIARRLPREKHLVQGCDASVMAEAVKAYVDALLSIKGLKYDLV